MVKFKLSKEENKLMIDIINIFCKNIMGLSLVKICLLKITHVRKTHNIRVLIVKSKIVDD